MPDERERPDAEPGRATLKEVARLAGVSRSTTSRVLNDHPSVRPDVRARVQRVMDEVGYVPDGVARSLRGGRSGIIGLVIPQPPATVFGDAYFAALVGAVVATSQGDGCTVATVLVDEPDGDRGTRAIGASERDGDLVERLATGGLLDGVVVTASVMGDPLAADLRRAGLHVVVVGEPGDRSIPSVDVDNHGGGRAAVEHLVHGGRRRLVVVGGPRTNASARSRRAGAREAAAAVGATVVADVTASDFSVDSGRRAMADLVAASDDLDFDGVVAGSDAIAFGAMKVLHDRGVAVPDQVGVVGFDDLAPARLADPRLTTVRQPIEQVGRRAVERLLDAVGGNPAATREVLEVELVSRGSTP